MADQDEVAVFTVGEMASLITPWALRVAVTLQLPDLIADGTTNLAELVTRTATNPDTLRRIIRYLTHRKIFHQPQPDQIQLTELGEVLHTNHPSQLANALNQNNAFRHRESTVISGMLEAVRTGQPVWDSVFGSGFWTDLDRDQTLSTGFEHAISGFADLLAGGISRSFEWESARHVVDVGGGTGRILAELLTTHPQLHGTLVDLPDSATRGAARFREQGVSERATVSGQSFFDSLPTGGDVYLLANILHCWSDEDSRRIITQCTAAADPGARIVVVDMIISDKMAEIDRFIVDESDLEFLVLFGTKVRSEQEFRLLGESAGLSLRTTTPIAPSGWWSLLTYRIDG